LSNSAYRQLDGETVTGQRETGYQRQ